MTDLKTVLTLNASSCLIFGLIFAFAGNHVDAFIGNELSAWLTPAIGVVLVFNGLHLIFSSRRSKALCPEILYFVAGDIAWVIGTITLISLGLMITSIQGIVASLVIALMVGSFAILQIMAYRRQCI